MKKIYLLIIMILPILSLFSCKKEEIIKYEKGQMLEFADNDTFYTNNEKCKFTLGEKCKNKKAKKHLTINFLDYVLDGTYSQSSLEYGSNRIIDYYEVYDGKFCKARFEIYSGSDEIVGIFFLNNEVDTTNLDVLSVDECFEIAKTYLGQRVNSSEYTYLSYSKVFSDDRYSFRFTRIIDGLPSNDSISIDIDKYGFFMGFSSQMLEQMKDSYIPDYYYEIEDIDQIFIDYCDKTYEGKRSRYDDINFKLGGKTIVKLRDGSYGILLVITVECMKLYNGDEMIFGETISLIYCLGN